MWSAALFWADKVSAIGGGDAACDVQLVAGCMLHKREYHRAAYTVTSRNLHKTHLMCHYIAARALLEAAEYTETLNLLDEANPELLTHNEDPPRNVRLNQLMCFDVLTS